MKGVAVILLLLIVASLGRALAGMSSRPAPEHSLRVVHALTARIALSVGLFVLLIAGYYLGWIQPHSLR